MRKLRRIGVSELAALALLLSPVAASSMTLTPAPLASEYLLVGTGSSVEVVATAVSNFELGANNDVVPMSGLAGSVPALPGNALAVGTGILGNGDTAITNLNGVFNFSNIDVFGNMGIDCARPTVGNCQAGLSNSNFNGSPMTPSNGLNANVNLVPLLDELMMAAGAINAHSSDITLNFSDDGIWDTSLSIVLASGLTVFDFDTGVHDLSLNSENLLIDGPSDAFAVFRIPDDDNFNVSGSNIVVGDGGIGLNNVLFFSDKQDNMQHININGAIVNGVAFWDLGMMENGEIHLDNVQGCTQVIAGKVNLNNVRIGNCAFVIPEPATGSLLALGLAGLAATASRRSRRAQPKS